MSPKIDAYNPEEIFEMALAKIPESYSQEFIASWLFLKFSPFSKDLSILHLHDLQQILITSLFRPRGSLREGRFAVPFLKQAQQFLMTFAENLGRYFFPGMRLHLEDLSFYLVDKGPYEAPISVKQLGIGATIEEATRARIRWAVQSSIYYACEQLYANEGKVETLPKNAFKKEGYRTVPNREVLESIPEFLDFRDYLIDQGYIDPTYYPKKDLRTIGRALKRRIHLLRYCPICGVEIKKPRINSSTCGSKKCTNKKSHTKKFISNLLKRNPSLTKEEIVKVLEVHGQEETKITKFRPYRQIKDKKTLVEIILRELRGS